MRSLRLISCGMAAAILTAAFAMAQSAPAPTAAESADRFTNSDLMAQPERERRIWLNALMVGATSVTGMHDIQAARCVARWYFEDEGELYRQILGSMEAYPDRRPAEVIFALARRECPSFIPSS